MLKYAQIITCHTVTQSRRPGGYSFQMSGSSNHTKYLTLHQNMDAVINHTARNKSFNGCTFVPRICKVFKKKSEKRPTLKRSTSFSASTVFSRLPLLCRLLFQESRVLRRRTACWENTDFDDVSVFNWHFRLPLVWIQLLSVQLSAPLIDFKCRWGNPLTDFLSCRKPRRPYRYRNPASGLLLSNQKTTASYF